VYRPAFFKCICGIAPTASQVAGGEPYKDAGFADLGGFTLDTEKDLVDNESI
jgi:hypothetical protein